MNAFAGPTFSNRRKFRDYEAGGIMSVPPTTAYSRTEDAAQTAIENLINRYVRPEQTKGRRRRPLGYRARVIYL
jgi:hypothetical protein